MLNRRGNVIVVTGAGGFLGCHVVPLVQHHAARARVIAVVRRGSRAVVASGVEVVHGDLRFSAVWRRLPPTVTHVIHLAAVIPWDRRDGNQSQVIIDNVAPVAQLLKASTRWMNLRHVVYASSVSVYAPSRRPLRESSTTAPTSAYGAAKLAGERLLELLTARGVAIASLRFSSIYGPGQYPRTVLPLFMDRARRGLPLHVFNGRRMQDFVHVEDAARATWLACRSTASGVFNVGSGRPVSMATLAREIADAFGPPTSASVECADARTGDAGNRIDIARARRMFGFQPRISLCDGLRQLAHDRRS